MYCLSSPLFDFQSPVCFHLDPQFVITLFQLGMPVATNNKQVYSCSLNINIYLLHLTKFPWSGATGAVQQHSWHQGFCQVWWCIPTVPLPKRMSPEDNAVVANLNSIVYYQHPTERSLLFISTILNAGFHSFALCFRVARQLLQHWVSCLYFRQEKRSTLDGKKTKGRGQLTEPLLFNSQ